MAKFLSWREAGSGVRDKRAPEPSVPLPDRTALRSTEQIFTIPFRADWTIRKGARALMDGATRGPFVLPKSIHTGALPQNAVSQRGGIGQDPYPRTWSNHGATISWYDRWFRPGEPGPLCKPDGGNAKLPGQATRLARRRLLSPSVGIPKGAGERRLAEDGIAYSLIAPPQRDWPLTPQACCIVLLTARGCRGRRGNGGVGQERPRRPSHCDPPPEVLFWGLCCRGSDEALSISPPRRTSLSPMGFYPALGAAPEILPVECKRGCETRDTGQSVLADS